jgi:Amt family ammonium transporter
MSTTSPWRMGVVAGIFCLLQATPLMASENTVATVNGADTAWMIVATALVLFMTLPGLALFYGGLVRSKNVLSVLVQCFALAGVMTLLWVAYGYSLAFSNGGTLQKFIGGFRPDFSQGNYS